MESLHLFEEHLQGERFVNTLEEPEDYGLLLYRRMFYESDWDHLCWLHGHDPAPDQLRVPSMGRSSLMALPLPSQGPWFGSLPRTLLYTRI